MAVNLQVMLWRQCSTHLAARHKKLQEAIVSSWRKAASLEAAKVEDAIHYAGCRRKSHVLASWQCHSTQQIQDRKERAEAFADLHERQRSTSVLKSWKALSEAAIEKAAMLQNLQASALMRHLKSAFKVWKRQTAEMSGLQRRCSSKISAKRERKYMALGFAGLAACKACGQDHEHSLKALQHVLWQRSQVCDLHLYHILQITLLAAF